jgi:hypothetical protein
MAKLHLPDGQIALVDDEDYERVRSGAWQTLRSDRNRTLYCQRRLNEDEVTCRKYRMLHREVLELRDGDKRCVRFLNGKGLDCTKRNLEIIRRSQLQVHRRKRSPATSKYVGVHWHDPQDQPHGYWKVSPHVTNNAFLDETAAAIARDLNHLKLFGDFGIPGLNFPDLILNRPARATQLVRLDRQHIARRRWFSHRGTVEQKFWLRQGKRASAYYASIAIDGIRHGARLALGGHQTKREAHAAIRTWLRENHPDAWPSKPSTSGSPRTRRSCVVP